MVSDVVLAVLGSMTGDISMRETALLHEIGTLGEAVAMARQEIAALKVDDITASYIPCATDELDAIVSHTAAATESILEACETLDSLGATLKGEAAQSLQDATVKIYESCSFQDITGQRITKVVSTLKTIEATIARIVATFGKASVERAAPIVPEAESLLNGPQLPASAMDQSDIDKLLASSTSRHGSGQEMAEGNGCSSGIAVGPAFPLRMVQQFACDHAWWRWRQWRAAEAAARGTIFESALCAAWRACAVASCPRWSSTCRDDIGTGRVPRGRDSARPASGSYGRDRRENAVKAGCSRACSGRAGSPAAKPRFPAFRTRFADSDDLERRRPLPVRPVPAVRARCGRRGIHPRRRYVGCVRRGSAAGSFGCSGSPDRARSNGAAPAGHHDSETSWTCQARAGVATRPGRLAHTGTQAGPQARSSHDGRRRSEISG